MNKLIVKCATSSLSYLNRTIFTSGLESQDAESSGHDHTLLAVIWWRNTFKKFEAVECGSATSSLVGNHATDCLKENLGGSAMMEWTRFLGVDDMAFMKEVVVAKLQPDGMLEVYHSIEYSEHTYLVAEEATGDVNLLASDYNNLLARQDLFGDNGRQPAQEVALTVNNDRA